MKKRHRANSIYQWLLYFGVALIGIILIIPNSAQVRVWQKYVYFVIFTYVSVGLFFNLTHSVYLCNTGVEYYCFGKLQRTLYWKDICQVCTMTLLPFSMKVSSPTYLLIIPNGCEKFNRSKRLGFGYLLLNRNRVLKIDNSKQNREMITLLYGELDNQT